MSIDKWNRLLTLHTRLVDHHCIRTKLYFLVDYVKYTCVRGACTYLPILQRNRKKSIQLRIKRFFSLFFYHTLIQPNWRSHSSYRQLPSCFFKSFLLIIKIDTTHIIYIKKKHNTILCCFLHCI